MTILKLTKPILPSMKNPLYNVRLYLHLLKKKLRHPVIYLITGLVFFISMGVLLYTRPVVLVDRASHDSILVKNDVLEHKAIKIDEDKARLVRQSRRLYITDSLMRKVTEENICLKDSIKTQHENFTNELHRDADIISFFTNQYK